MTSEMPGLGDLNIKVLTKAELDNFQASPEVIRQLDDIRTMLKAYEEKNNIDDYKERDELEKPIYENLRSTYIKTPPPSANNKYSQENIDMEIENIKIQEELLAAIDDSKRKRTLYNEIKQQRNNKDCVNPKKQISPYLPNVILAVKADERRTTFVNKIFNGCRKIPMFITKVEDGFRVPALVGCIPQDNDHIAESGDMVAALIHNIDYDERVWMLAVVVLYSKQEDSYRLSDIDALGSDTVYVVPAKGVISLPHFRANQKYSKCALHKVGERVMAVCPGTTLFLIGIVERQPFGYNDDYMIVLFHPKFRNGVSRPQYIPQRLVVSMSNPHLI